MITGRPEQADTNAWEHTLQCYCTVRFIHNARSCLLLNSLGHTMSGDPIWYLPP